MGQPTQTDVHVDQILTNISIAYMQNQDNFIASKVFPIIPVAKQSDKYYTYDKNDWFRDEAQRRADSTESAGSGYGLSTAAYACDVYAFHKDIGDRVRKNADAPLNLDTEAAQFVMSRILLRQEIQFVSDYLKTTVWGTDVVGNVNFTYWDDYANSDPIEDVETAKETVLGNTGFEINTMVIGYQAWRKLKRHPLFTDRIKYTSADNITPAMVARLLEIDNLYIAKGIKATNIEGATAAYSFVYGKDALLCHVAPSPGLLKPSAGYIFAWAGLAGGMGTSVATSTYRMDLKKADRIETESAWDNKVVATDLGYYLSAAVS
jgi:hypothetical protein